MPWPLIINPEAEADLADARAWYEAQRPGLGDEMLECVEEVFNHLRLTPTLFGKVFDELRLVRVRRFPDLVVYRIDDDQVTVIAVYHSRRDPRGWQNRVQPQVTRDTALPVPITPHEPLGYVSLIASPQPPSFGTILARKPWQWSFP